MFLMFDLPPAGEDNTTNHQKTLVVPVLIDPKVLGISFVARWYYEGGVQPEYLPADQDWDFKTHGRLCLDDF